MRKLGLLHSSLLIIKQATGIWQPTAETPVCTDAVGAFQQELGLLHPEQVRY